MRPRRRLAAESLVSLHQDVREGPAGLDLDPGGGALREGGEAAARFTECSTASV
ncbi:hypothetical protein [Kitasatospora aureofaciens]|uniref:hypothetical protein n=1 Tax=Kitasatospora aureofaciens TaxID=1894 RepID=UPI0037C8F278